MKNKHNAGFSLVELAIVLIVMGLIIGGVLKGRELIESAKLKAVMAQVNEFRVATSTFLDMFDALPGDYNAAAEHIDSKLNNGNGNGVIEGAGLDKSSEAGQFWQHLIAAGLLSDSGGIDGEKLQFGHGAPSSKIGGGFTIRHEEGKHWFILGAENGQNGDGALLTAAQAFSLDKKIDNGAPTSGKVMSFDGKDVAAGSCVTPDGKYNTKNKAPACVMKFMF